ncbi:MAG: 5-formyltetrahydrofolate cyclo-ligase [Streptosporangiaceae bacterium]
MTATKQAVRERVWSQLERAGVVQSGVRGYIPAFAGADQASERLADLTVWQRAQILEVVPDRAQLPVRIRALRDGKLVYMAAPRLATPEPFYLLDPRNLPVSATEAADRTVAAHIAPGISVSEMRAIDLLVCGSVAVNERGARLGKGAGYSDIEVALLTEAGLISERTVIATTVHELQVLSEDLPEQAHDFRVDLIVTPERVIWPRRPKRPARLDVDTLSSEQIAAIPVLAQRVRR